MNIFPRIGRAWARRLAFASTLLACATGGSAWAGDLLVPVTAREMGRAAVQAAPAVAAVRQRVVRLDREELWRHLAPPGLDRASDRVQRAMRLDGVATIELFPDAAATFRRTGVDSVGDSGVTWTGAVAGRPSDVATLVIEDGEITGAVQLAQRYFRIDPIGRGLHRVAEIDRTRLPHSEDDFLVPPSGPAERPARSDRSAAEPRAATRIRVLVAYTRRAKAQSANIGGEIKLAVQLANAAYANTNVPIKLVLAGIMQAGSYNESSDWGRVLQDVSGLNGSVLSSVRQKRNQVSADLVALIRSDTGGIGGIAWAPEFPSSGTDGYGFSVQAIGGLTSGIVFPHELGHNMGLYHDRRTNGGNPPPSKYNFGYINNNAGLIDIMSYLSSCTRACRYVQWFSTAKLRYQPGNVKLGIPKGTSGAADATRRLRETRAAIASYR
jgi:hypothetical protein